MTTATTITTTTTTATTITYTYVRGHALGYKNVFCNVWLVKPCRARALQDTIELSRPTCALPVHLLRQVSKIAVSSRRNPYFQKIRSSILELFWEPFCGGFGGRFGGRFGGVLGGVSEPIWGPAWAQNGPKIKQK